MPACRSPRTMDDVSSRRAPAPRRMSRWEAPRSRRTPGRVLLSVLLAVAGVTAALALLPGRPPTGDDPRATPVVDDAAWTRPRPGLWIPLPAAPVTSRIDHAIAGRGDRVAVWGGFDARGHPLHDGAVFDLGTGTWTPVPGTGSGGAAAEAAWVGDEVVIVTPTATRAYHTVQRTWRDVPALPLADAATLEHLGVTRDVLVAATRPVADGGGGPAVLAWPHDARRWRRLPDPPVGTDDGAILVSTDARLTVLRPGASGHHGVGADLDPTRSDPAWRSTAPPPATTRPIDRLLAASVGDRIVLVGAADDGDAMYAAVRDDPGGWRRLPVPPVAVTRDADLLATARDAVVWDRRAGAGAALDIVTGRWTRVPPSPAADGVPRPAVAAGPDLVTWGGLGPIGAVHRLR